MKNGEKHGYGIIYHDFENDWIYRYEGEFKYNVSDGYGIMYFKDGSIYNGEFKKILKMKALVVLKDLG